MLPDSINGLIHRLRQAADNETLSRDDRLDTVSAVRHAIVPRRRPGKKKDQRIDEAYADFTAGMRGLKLYRKHIRGFARLSRWRRKVEVKRLMDNLYQRQSRARKAQQ